MLIALRVADALAIADAALKRSRDERAMVDYLGIGRRRNRVSVPGAPASLPLLKPTAIDLAAFESDERQQLRDALTQLSEEARHELIALIWLARRSSLRFDAALRRARRIPADAQIGYLMGQRLEHHIAAGLEKLGA